jgi:putative peptidoglycan lipid II flippase
MDAFRSELARAMRLAFLLAVPSTVGLMMLAEPIISVVYQHGKFNAYQAEQAAGALRFYAIGLAGYAALKVLVNAFYALERRKTPMLVSFLAVGMNLLFNWIFTFRMGWGHRGLAFSTGCIATCNFLLLYALMQRQLHGLETRRMLTLLAKIGIACGALAAVCAASSHWLLADWRTEALWIKVAALLATIAAAALVFAGVSLLVRIEEMHELSAAIVRRLRRAIAPRP